MSNGKHLTYNDRLLIEKCLRRNYSKQEIANLIGCSVRTIYYEIKRGGYIHTNSDLTEEKRYSPEKADSKYRSILRNKGKHPILLKNSDIKNYISFMIKEYKFSPKAVINEIKNNDIKFQYEISSVNTIYSAIYKGYFDEITMEHLPKKRKLGTKKKKIKVMKRHQAGTSIEKRPEEVNNREVFGHWEMDCVIGKSRNRKTLLVLTERKTRYQILEVLKYHTTDEVVKAINRIEKRFKSMFYKIFKTITVDNGSEFSDSRRMEKAMYRVGNRTNVYYCHPYAPYERGSNENANHLVRRFFPKGCDFDKKINRNIVKDVEDWINHYPRDLLKGGYSIDLFNKELSILNKV